MSMLLGVAIPLTIIGVVSDASWLRWAFPGLVIALMLMARYWPFYRGDRFVDQLRKAVSELRD